METITIRPLELFNSSIGCCTVPGLTMEQYVSLQDRQETEVSEESANYLLKHNYAEKA